MWIQNCRSDYLPIYRISHVYIYICHVYINICICECIYIYLYMCIYIYVHICTRTTSIVACVGPGAVSSQAVPTIT